VGKGTTQDPARRAPKKASAYSIEFSPRSATLSPRREPQAERALLTRSSEESRHTGPARVRVFSTPTPLPHACHTAAGTLERADPVDLRRHRAWIPEPQALERILDR
jgi:hypothetical protein